MPAKLKHKLFKMEALNVTNETEKRVLVSVTENQSEAQIWIITDNSRSEVRLSFPQVVSPKVSTNFLISVEKGRTEFKPDVSDVVLTESNRKAEVSFKDPSSSQTRTDDIYGFIVMELLDDDSDEITGSN